MRDDVLSAFSADPARAMLALDFDGTLAPIVVDPQDSRPLPGVIEALGDLAGQGVQIAVITGRDAETAVRLGGLDAIAGITVAGLYGAQLWRDGALSSPEPPAAIQDLRARLPQALEQAAADPAVWIEDKGLSLVVHARKADDPVAALDGVRAAVTALGDDLGLDVHPGRDVLELRLPGYDKGTALEHLVGDLRPACVVFAGDDLGDVPAFEQVAALRARGISAFAVGVASAEVPELGPVDLTVDGPAGMLELLRDLAGQVAAH